MRPDRHAPDRRPDRLGGGWPADWLGGAPRVAVLGIGLIGGSVLQAAARAGAEVVGIDPDPGTAAAAAAAGFEVADDVGAAVHGADLVVLAMPLPEVEPALRSVAALLSPDAVLTDVGTLKQPVLAAVRAHHPRAAFVGGHPLAGVEETGWAAADPDLFRDAPWALTLEHDTRLDAWLRVADFVCRLGARPVPTSAAEQDAAVARVIGLPHVLAEALALTGLAGGPLGLSLAAGSYRSGSRVARTRPELVTTWCDDNPALVTALDDAIAHLREARDALAQHSSILPLAQAGHRARMEWEQRGGTQVVLAADAPQLREHGARGGWLTAVERDPAGVVRLRGVTPTVVPYTGQVRQRG
ncbi:prephenate dehydrogenase [uncultured Jatrophihabitans sp.]|uniref:prephenate dehydrogenase n=1 Tax=uncultured Jatrophihabitans sp. TaxID=1610747 RepID=UPI0035CACAA2